MKTNILKQILMISATAVISHLSGNLAAQPDWVATPGAAIVPRTIEAKDMVYSNGHFFTASTKYNSGGHYDLSVSKTNTLGTIISTVSKNYHGYDDVPVKIIADASGNVYVLSTAAYYETDRDIWIVKYDANLALVWERFFHLSDESAVDMIISGSSLYVLGNTVSSTKGSDVLLLKYTTGGTYTASATFSFGTTTNHEAGKQLISDGTNLFICGYRDTAVTGRDGLLLKYNTSLALQWSKAWSPVSALSSETFNCLTYNGSYLFIGGSTSTATTKTDFLVARFNKSTGAYSSRTTANSTANNDEIRKIGIYGSDLYVTGISEYSITPVKNKTVTTKFNTSLVQAGAPWPRIFQPGSFNYECNDMAIGTFGAVAVCGTVKKMSVSGIAYTTAFTLIYNVAGDVLTEYQTPNNIGCNTVESTGNSIVYYGSYDFDIAIAGGNKAWLNTIDFISAGRIEKTTTLIRPGHTEVQEQNNGETAGRSGIQEENDLEAIDAFPNPAQGELSLKANQNIIRYIVTDLNGKVIQTGTSNEKEVKLDVSKLDAGTYLVTIETASGKANKRFIKL